MGGRRIGAQMTRIRFGGGDRSQFEIDEKDLVITGSRSMKLSGRGPTGDIAIHHTVSNDPVCGSAAALPSAQHASHPSAYFEVLCQKRRIGEVLKPSEKINHDGSIVSTAIWPLSRS